MTFPTETPGAPSTPAGKAGAAHKTPATDPTRPIDAAAVKAFLAANPDVLHDEPDLLAKLAPDTYRDANGVVDFQVFTIDRLQQEIEDLRELQHAMVTAAEENSISRDHIFSAVLKVLDARNFEHLIHYITTDLAADIDVDVIALGVEAASPSRRIDGIEPATASGQGPAVVVLKTGMVDALLGTAADGTANDYTLRDDADGVRELFGDSAVHVQSEALIRLVFSHAAPPGLLALGSTRANLFYPELAVDHLNFLARVIERSVRQWLDLPPA